MVEDGAFSHKISKFVWKFKILKGIQIALLVQEFNSAILLNGWILPIDGASAVEGLLSTGPTPSR